VILATADALFDVGIEGLDADLELEGAGWELGDEFAEGFGEAVGHHFEVDEETGGTSFEKELKDASGDDGMKVEGAVDELELADAAVEELLEGIEEGSEGELTDGDVEGRQAEFAGEGTAAGGFDVNDPVGAIGVVVEGVGQGDAGGIGDGSVEDARGDFAKE
jgi:hypothetical protein